VALYYVSVASFHSPYIRTLIFVVGTVLSSVADFCCVWSGTESELRKHWADVWVYSDSKNKTLRVFVLKERTKFIPQRTVSFPCVGECVCVCVCESEFVCV